MFCFISSMHACQATSFLSDSLCPYGLEPTMQLLCPLDSLGKNTGVGCHALLQGIFLTQGLKLRLLAALTGGFFATSATWDVAYLSQHLA